MNTKKWFLSRIIVIIALLVSFVSASFSTTLFAAGLGTTTSPYSVAEGMANQNNAIKTVQGYVVGQPTSATTILTSGYPNDYAIALADSATETNTAKMIYVQISTNYRSTFGLKTNPSLKGSLVKVTGNLTAYFTHAGIKNTTYMEKVSSGSTGGGGTPTTNYDSTYYSTALGKSGSTLKSALHNIIDDHREISYDAAWDALRNTDEDPTNKNNVILLYTGRSQGKFTNGTGNDSWNREHVWAKSHGDFGTTLGAGTDLHHLRPTDVTVNSSRGNKDFDNGGTQHIECTGCKADSDSWEPPNAVKGDVARMLFYMAVRYEGDSGELNLELNNYVNNGTLPYHGVLSTLKLWNQQDPVDNFERRRNDVIYQNYQYNRNPFIDHPEWVSSIWGN